jgi:hypothetical protein
MSTYRVIGVAGSTGGKLTMVVSGTAAHGLGGAFVAKAMTLSRCGAVSSSIHCDEHLDTTTCTHHRYSSGM